MKDLPKEAFIAGTNAVNETLKYSCATAEYTGLVSLSYIRRGGCYVYDPLSKAMEPVCDIAVNAYKQTMEPVCDIAVSAYKQTAEGITSAYKKTGDGIEWAYKKTGDGLGWLADAIPMPFGGKRMREVEARLIKIEEWMENIDKHGLVMPQRGAGGARKKLTEEKEALLKNILLDNLELKAE